MSNNIELTIERIRETLAKIEQNRIGEKDTELIPVELAVLQILDLVEEGNAHMDIIVSIRNGRISNIKGSEVKLNPLFNPKYADILEALKGK